MTLDEALFACLSNAASATAALIGEGAACRAWPMESAEGGSNGLAYLVFGQIASESYGSHGVPGNAEDTLDESLYQFSCYAPTLAAAKALRRALRADLMAPGAMVGIVVTNPGERAGDEPATDQKRADLDITFFHNPQALPA